MTEDTRLLAQVLCEALDLVPDTITRLTLTVDVAEPYPILDVSQIVTEPVEIDGDRFAESFVRFELHRKEAP